MPKKKKVGRPPKKRKVGRPKKRKATRKKKSGRGNTATSNQSCYGCQF